MRSTLMSVAITIMLMTCDLPCTLTQEAQSRAHPAIIPMRQSSTTFQAPTVETPASIACIYGVVQQVAGCPVNGTSLLPSGGTGHTIAVVVAYDYPAAGSDLSAFSSQYGLPSPNLQVFYSSGSQPPQDSTGKWEREAALDIEWAHAMAPNATIMLIEAASDSDSDLHQAELSAGYLASTVGGGGAVSMSFVRPEYSGEHQNDPTFSYPNVVYLAATGDTAFQLSYPAVSVNVVAVGGTSISRDSNGNYLGESYWDNQYGGGGGGSSSYETRPAFQGAIANITGSSRGTPDVSAASYPGVAVYDSIPSPDSNGNMLTGWWQLSGTSVATPIMAGRLMNLGIFGSSSDFLSSAYTSYSSGTVYPYLFKDITTGNGSCMNGWDVCSGIGILVGTNIPLLSASTLQDSFGNFGNSSYRPVTKTYTFTNDSPIPINVNHPSLLENDNYSLFYQGASSCSGTLSSGSSCSVSITFDPSNAGGSGTYSVNATLQIQSNAWNPGLQIQLNATMNCRTACSK